MLKPSPQFIKSNTLQWNKSLSENFSLFWYLIGLHFYCRKIITLAIKKPMSSKIFIEPNILKWNRSFFKPQMMVASLSWAKVYHQTSDKYLFSIPAPGLGYLMPTIIWELLRQFESLKCSLPNCKIISNFGNLNNFYLLLLCTLSFISAFLTLQLVAYFIHALFLNIFPL